MTIILTEQQNASLDILFRFATRKTDHSMAVLSGYAGTGKTTLISTLIKKLDGVIGPIAVAAPTNKAVRVLKENIESYGVKISDCPRSINKYKRSQDFDLSGSDDTDIEFGSIHSFLGLQLKEMEDGSQECKPSSPSSLHEFELVIVDECSMIGDELFGRIAASKQGALILFVGDPAQLPPISVLDTVSPTFSRVQLSTSLSEVVRQAKDNPIIALSMAVREAMEEGVRILPQRLYEALPEPPAHAGIMAGDMQVSMDVALSEIKAGRDARIIAYTNSRVIAYNRAVHVALYGSTEAPYVDGERVIVNQQSSGQVVDERSGPMGLKASLITSEECEVVRIEPDIEDDINVYRLILLRDGGQLVEVAIPQDEQAVKERISSFFDSYRAYRMEADNAKSRHAYAEQSRLENLAKTHSKKAWKLKNRFADLRHAYAITAHKSQGSTFDTSIVDLSDMSRIRSVFQFNRALYVAITRSSEYLAIVV